MDLWLEKEPCKPKEGERKGRTGTHHRKGCGVVGWGGVIRWSRAPPGERVPIRSILNTDRGSVNIINTVFQWYCFAKSEIHNF